ncbi:MAG: shikimate kinase AroK [Gammaproteobacteria bacterium]|nr:shikimate kinase AroK [Gammaproteobacteria bacterium]
MSNAADAPNNIFLVGPMGAGKSTVGRHLARLLNKIFLDCDRELEEHTGARISIIFELEGESGFRKRESAMLKELASRDNIVLATGGGVVLDADNRSLLKSRGFNVYLDAPLELLVQRTSRDRHRPLLQTEDREAKIKSLLKTRDPLYREVADMIVTSDRGSSKLVAREILRRFKNR